LDAETDFLIRLRDEDALRACAWVTTQLISICGEELRVAGIRGVMTDPDRRRRGYGRAVMERAQALMRSQTDCEIALLFSSVMAVPFYESLGWRLDADLVVDDGYRVVQVTPPGSGCSIIFGTGLTAAQPGSAEGLQLSVYDLDEARADLIARGVDVSQPFHDVTGIFHHAGTQGRLDGAAPEHADYGSFASFADPDGNGWLLQEIKTRLPGR